MLPYLHGDYMRILVLGAGGFIGRQIVGTLLDAGHGSGGNSAFDRRSLGGISEG